MTSTLAVSAVIPCFQEADHLPETILELGDVLRMNLRHGFEVVLIVSDAAGDGTAGLADTLAAEHDWVRAVRQPAGVIGYGRAVAQGFQAARFPWLLLLDGDGQFDPLDLPRFLTLADQADLVIGFRHPRADSLIRRISGTCYTTLAASLFGLGPVHDIDCGFKLLRSRVLEGLTLRSRTGAVNVEILSAARARGARILQVPVSHHRRRGGRSRVEIRTGPACALPRPREVLALLLDLVALRTGPRRDPV